MKAADLRGKTPDHKDLITAKVPLKDVMSVFDIVAKGEAIKVTVEP